jgi:hypothetical protein
MRNKNIVLLIVVTLAGLFLLGMYKTQKDVEAVERACGFPSGTLLSDIVADLGEPPDVIGHLDIFDEKKRVSGARKRAGYRSGNVYCTIILDADDRLLECHRGDVF